MMVNVIGWLSDSNELLQMASNWHQTKKMLQEAGDSSKEQCDRISDLIQECLKEYNNVGKNFEKMNPKGGFLKEKASQEIEDKLLVTNF